MESSRFRLITFFVLSNIFVALLAPVAAQGQGRSMRTRHMRDAVSKGQAAHAGSLPASQYLKLNIALPLRNESDLDQLLQDLYNPQSPSYRQFLTVSEFTARFGPREEDYDAVIRYAQANGLTVTGTSPGRTLVNVTGPVANVEKAFHVNMGRYHHPTEARDFFAPDREPTADLPFPLWHITGLDNFSIPSPMNLMRSAGATGNTTGSGPNGYFIGSDFRAAYYGGKALTGKGQSVGLLEFAGYNEQDVINYFQNVGQTNTVPIVGVSVDGSSLSCTGSCDDGEQVLDIEVAISMAPGMDSVRVYVSNTSDVAILDAMATDIVLATQLSCSWGWIPADPVSDDPWFQRFAAQGQNFFVASGDNGAFKKGSKYVYPADDPYVTSVGGTNLTTNGAGGAWKSETAWPGSGGGISPNNLAIPAYQTTAGVITKTNQGSTVYRNVPDVAAEANTDNYICYNGTCAGGWGGTSFAAPRWAGFMALVNQQAKGGGLGFINPSLYNLGLGSSYTNAFHDITTGNNKGYSALPGYDLVTGWGTPNGTMLINVLTK